MSPPGLHAQQVFSPTEFIHIHAYGVPTLPVCVHLELVRAKGSVPEVSSDTLPAIGVVVVHYEIRGEVGQDGINNVLVMSLVCFLRITPTIVVDGEFETLTHGAVKSIPV